MDAFDALDALLRPRCRAQPYERYAALRAAGPSVTAAGQIVLARYRECAEALRHRNMRIREPENTRTPPARQADNAAVRILHRSVLGRDDDAHQLLRSVLGRPFHPRAAANLADVTRRTAGPVIDDLLTANGPVDLIDDFAAVLPMTVLAELLGLDPALIPSLVRDVPALSYANDGAASGADMARADTAARVLLAHAARHMAGPTTGVLTELAATPLDEQTILANIIMLIAAGTETTRQLIGNTLQLLLSDQRLAERLRADPDPLPGYLTELIRLQPPAHLTSRWNIAPTTVGAAALPANRRVLIVLAAANRDSNQFPDPDAFDPCRGAEGLSFGAGAHYCLGATLARVTARVGIEHLLARTTRITPASPPSRHDHLVIRGYHHIPATLAG